MRSADDEKQRNHRESVQKQQGEAVQRILRADERDRRTILNLSHTSSLTTAEVTKAFRQQSLLVHPDKNSAADAEEAFKKLQHAYAQLKEEVGRAPRAVPTVPSNYYGGAAASSTGPRGDAGTGGHGYAGRAAGGSSRSGNAEPSRGAYGSSWSRAQDTAPPWGADHGARDEYSRWTREESRRANPGGRR